MQETIDLIPDLIPVSIVELYCSNTSTFLHHCVNLPKMFNSLIQ